jgi:hypothetical protein
MAQQLIPFCVADRPISLSIIKGASLASGLKLGIMSQAATTSDQFKRFFASYPYKTEVVYSNGEPADQAIRSRTIKMVDSGIFGKNGCHLTYEDLFAQYRLMRADYGIMIDAMGDVEETIKSARKALKHYDSEQDRFKLVGVAQGTTVPEYIRCYEKLQNMGIHAHRHRRFVAKKGEHGSLCPSALRKVPQETAKEDSRRLRSRMAVSLGRLPSEANRTVSGVWRYWK